ncbi:hypothetical protein BU14_0072s0090 [Porphyra umbilicalis]|uniref:Uncharacterized protein n=1 Tax=Porphyra umbilicalis TaxID=2786 RepID=A0A1X6PGD7_PORUM|nr:hypothetical protein BU14_0072s0090 [Porphyra umbilicalis]|eukprot:OSX79733.1 hypothetical protein BU14_0072s0090 [Porphyra umbilicalis]
MGGRPCTGARATGDRGEPIVSIGLRRLHWLRDGEGGWEMTTLTGRARLCSAGRRDVAAARRRRPAPAAAPPPHTRGRRRRHISDRSPRRPSAGYTPLPARLGGAAARCAAAAPPHPPPAAAADAAGGRDDTAGIRPHGAPPIPLTGFEGRGAANQAAAAEACRQSGRSPRLGGAPGGVPRERGAGRDAGTRGGPRGARPQRMRGGRGVRPQGVGQTRHAPEAAAAAAAAAAAGAAAAAAAAPPPITFQLCGSRRRAADRPRPALRRPTDGPPSDGGSASGRRPATDTGPSSDRAPSSPRPGAPTRIRGVDVRRGPAAAGVATWGPRRPRSAVVTGSQRRRHAAACHAGAPWRVATAARPARTRAGARRTRGTRSSPWALLAAPPPQAAPRPPNLRHGATRACRHGGSAGAPASPHHAAAAIMACRGGWRVRPAAAAAQCQRR